MPMQKTHYRSWQMTPERTKCGIHKRGHPYKWTTDWGMVTCNRCRRWARQLLDGIDIANNRKPQGDKGWPQPITKG